MMTLDVGTGAPVLLLHGFGLSPALYRRSAEELAARGQVRVVVPSLYDVSGPWTPESALGHLVATLDQLGLQQVTCIGHSFGGCFQLGLAATRGDRVVELVFCDTLAWTRRWDLARQALRPVNLVLLATAGAAIDFVHSSLTHPIELAQAAWHGFVGDHLPLVAAVGRSGIPSHVCGRSETLSCAGRKAGRSRPSWGRTLMSSLRGLGVRPLTTIGCIAVQSCSSTVSNGCA
jgi:pimeloyl-ACP methyl ester carboxylesterase